LGLYTEKNVSKRKRRKKERATKRNRETDLLQQHKEDVREGLKKNLMPKQIAEIICT
jgi:hypothetical protein